MNEEEQPPLPPESAPAQAGSDSGTAPEISRRVGAILDAVEREATRLREEARAEAGHYLQHAQRRADGLVDERRRRIADLSDELIAKSEAVVARLDDAAPVRQGFENLVRALGDAAERLSQETEISQGDFEPPPFSDAAIASSEAAHPAEPTERSYDPLPQQLGPPAYEQQQQPARHQTPTSQPGPSTPPHPAYTDPAVSQPSSAASAPRSHPARAPTPPGWGASIGSGGSAPPQVPAQRDDDWQALDDARMIAIQMASSGATRAGVREHMHSTLGIADTTPILDEVFGPGSGEDARVPWTSAPR